MSAATRLRRALAPLALIALAVAGCRRPVTEIVLRIETDMAQGPGQTLTAVRVIVRTQEMLVRSDVVHRLDPRGGASAVLPAELGITARDNDGARRIEVELVALHDGTPLFTQRAAARFAHERTTLLTVFLADRCRAPDARATCAAPLQCGRGGCEPIERAELPPFDRDAAPVPPDATPTHGLDVPAPFDAPPPLDAGCAAGTTRCGAACISTRDDARNCGGCGVDCTSQPHVDPATARCVEGVCRASCEPDFADCVPSAPGCETALSTTLHCGACGRACDAAAPMCSRASGRFECATGCGAGETACGGRCVDTASDATHCGRCGNPCPGGEHATPACRAGACALACEAGFHLCAGRCVDDNAVATCGAACTPCPARAHATASCAAGACTYACEPGWGDCNGLPGDGCEAPLSTATHCGRCGLACGAATPVCVPGGTTGTFRCAVACTPGALCTPPGGCSTGAVDCASGAPVCRVVAPLAAGTACAGGVCNGAGACVACTAGARCAVAGQPCQNGAISCVTGAPVCVRVSNVVAGTACAGGVCNGAGACVACTAGAPCATGNECTTGQYSCASGGPVCLTSGNRAAGTPCMGRGVCDGAGRCSVCVAGTPCVAPTECRVGETACTDAGLAYCVAARAAPAGTACTGGVCDSAGACVPCIAGMSCPSANPCATNVQRCTGGPSCVLSSYATAGTACPGGTCDGAGVCVPTPPPDGDAGDDATDGSAGDVATEAAASDARVDATLDVTTDT